MPTISDISFTVKFDLTSSPQLVLTDTSTIPSGATGIFTITLPDNYNRVGSHSSPDIVSSGAAYSSPLRLDSTGQVQTGQYTIKYEIKTSDNVVSTFSRIFQFYYVPVELQMTEDFDVFTPKLTFKDDTNYQVSTYNYGAITKAWSVYSIPTGTMSFSTNIIDLIFGGKYYDASYTVTLTSTLKYTHQVYTWLTVQETIIKQVKTFAETPTTLDGFVIEISELKKTLDGLVNTNQPYYDAKAAFESAQTFFTHIMDKLKVGNTLNIYKDLKDLMAVINGYQVPVYVAKNAQILPYDLGAYAGAPKWGSITGNIALQTDLYSYIQLFTKRDNYIHDQQLSSITWNIVHNMGKFPSVTILDTAGDEVEGDVTHISINQLTITFSAAVAGKALLN
jgi:hypothetical protein